MIFILLFFALLIKKYTTKPIIHKNTTKPITIPIILPVDNLSSLSSFLKTLSHMLSLFTVKPSLHRMQTSFDVHFKQLSILEQLSY